MTRGLATALAAALVQGACAGPPASQSAAPRSASVGTPEISPARSASPSVDGWTTAGQLDAGGGDPTRTTPPYVNPGSLGHPQAYQGGQAE